MKLYKTFTIILLSCYSLGINAEVLNYEQALELRKSGKHVEAEQHFKALIAKDKNNAELWFQLGLGQRFQQKIDQAMLSQKHALSLSPENQDIRLELARLAYWKKDYGVAEKLVKKVLAVYPDYLEAQDLSKLIVKAKKSPDLSVAVESPQRPTPAPEVPENRWQIDLGHENSSFSRRLQPDWTYRFINLSYWAQENTLLHFRSEDIKRRNQHNRHHEVGVVHIFDDTFNAYLNIGHTPNSIFTPVWRFKSGAEFRLLFNHEYLGDTWLTGSIQHDRYRTLSTTVIKPGFRYALNDHWQIQAQQITVIDENKDRLTGWSSRLDWDTPVQGLRIFAGRSIAPETENQKTVNTRAKFAGLSYKVTPTATIHLSYSKEDRENSFIRNIGAATLSIKF